MSKTLFNQNTFQSKNVTNSDDVQDLKVDTFKAVNLTATNAILTNITNSELQAATSGVSTNATNITANTSAISTNATNITGNTIAIATNATAISGKQDALTTGDGIDIDGDLITFDGTISQGITSGGNIQGVNLKYIDGGVVTDVKSKIDTNASGISTIGTAVAANATLIQTKQDALTSTSGNSGTNISINDSGVISSTNTTYSATSNGGLAVSGTEFSLDLTNTNADIVFPLNINVTGSATVGGQLAPNRVYINNSTIDNNIDNTLNDIFSSSNGYTDFSKNIELDGDTSNYRKYFIGLLGDASSNNNVLAIAVNSGGGDDPNIVLGINRDGNLELAGNININGNTNSTSYINTTEPCFARLIVTADFAFENNDTLKFGTSKGTSFENSTKGVDNKSAYNISTGKFTCPQKGIYLISIHAIFRYDAGTTSPTADSFELRGMKDTDIVLSKIKTNPGYLHGTSTSALINLDWTFSVVLDVNENFYMKATGITSGNDHYLENLSQLNIILQHALN